MVIKTLSFLSLAILSVAFLLSLDSMAPTRLALMNAVNGILKNRDLSHSHHSSSDSDNDKAFPTKVFTKQELAGYKGENGGDVYLAIAGSVYDVSKGRRHYGPGGGYEFFAGIDGSRGFVTGEFDTKGLVDDISDFSNSQVLSLDGWRSFYEKDYSLIGVVEGSLYDSNGKETDMMLSYKEKLNLANKEKDLVENDRQLFPPCNSEWSQNSGSRVWCTKLSGGVKRDWEGLPRMYYTTGSSKPRCACIKMTGPPSHDPNSDNHKNTGDLDNPNLSLYPGCEPLSNSCVVRN